MEPSVRSWTDCTEATFLPRWKSGGRVVFALSCEKTTSYGHLSPTSTLLRGVNKKSKCISGDSFIINIYSYINTKDRHPFSPVLANVWKKTSIWSSKKTPAKSWKRRKMTPKLLFFNHLYSSLTLPPQGEEWRREGHHQPQPTRPQESTR